MTDKYEVENLLRPPIELQSAIVSAIFTIACIIAPHMFSISQEVGYGFAILFSIPTIIRAHQGFVILRYHRNIKRLPRYVLSLSKLKISSSYLFMGRGFKWREGHTERLYAARERKNERYVKLSSIYQWVRNFEYQVERGKLKFIAKVTAMDVFFNPFRKLPDVGGDPVLHGVGITDERDITMRLDNRYGHHIVCGSTRVGKSRKLELYLTQDIHRNKDDLIVVIDPKGDADILRRTYVEAKAAGRLSELMIFHLGYPEISCAYNPLESFTKLTELSTRVTGGLPENGNARAFKDYAWQFTNVFSKGLFFVGEVPNYTRIKSAFKRPDLVLIKYAEKLLKSKEINYELEVESILSDLKKRKQKSNNTRSLKADALCIFVRDNEVYDATLEDLIYIHKQDSEYFAKISSAIGPFLEKVTSGKVGEILSGTSTKDNPKPVLDWMELYKRGGIVYIGLDALTDVETGGAVAEATFAALTSLAGYIYKHDVDADTPFSTAKKRNIIIHGDELSDLIGPKFVPLANKGGGAGVQLTLYTQTMSDIEVKLGNEARANQVLTNINTIEFMRVQDEKTAKLMINKLPEVNVSIITAVSGVSDNAGQGGTVGFVSQNEDRTTTQRVPMLQVADIAGLPKGQSFCLMDGNQLYKLRAPMPSKKDHESLPSSIFDVAVKMEEAYKSDIEWGSLRDVA
ncbi:type IV conjugative transfer system coupling protein TraD [Aliikangiella maris]|uniref:Type IV conjugative transfer system coupling protein TraD n=2 Tax=Aliikangiella maris TaxID=3162458 RepID=A0ABV3MTS9_9GAMM